MINANWLFLIIPGCLVLGFLIRAARESIRKADKLVQEIINKAQAITEATEEIIQASIDHAEIVDSRSFHDYDIDINKEGEEKIRKILEAL